MADVKVNPEKVEKVRQAIMRYRELLNIMRLKVEQGERRYNQLFAGISEEEVKNTKEKDLQRKVALQILEDVSPLTKAVLQSQYDAREMHQAFDELYNIILTPLPYEDEDE